MSKKKYNIAVVGATGMVGMEMIKVLEELDFPVGELRPLASERSAGLKVSFKDRNYAVLETTKDSFAGIDIALFSAGAAVSEKFAADAVKAGAVVIDNTSFFRMDPAVPLVVPEVNGSAVKKHQGIIANPNCSTAQMVLPLKAIYDLAGIKRVVVSTYQAVSGAGKEAMDSLLVQTEAILNGHYDKHDKGAFAHQIAFNLIPHIDVFLANGYTKEEMKMIQETKKILEDEKIEVTATCVRVPVFIGHSESVNVETTRPVSLEEVRQALSIFPNLVLEDCPEENIYPMPINCSTKNDTFVGRLRKDLSCPNGFDMWVVSDNLRKGAAFNAVQIAQELIKQEMI